MKNENRELEVSRSKGAKGSSQVFEGVLVPADWDDLGKVIGISLSTGDECEYEISSSDRKLEKRLLEHLRRRVRLTAGIDDDGRLNVSRIVVLDRMPK